MIQFNNLNSSAAAASDQFISSIPNGSLPVRRRQPHHGCDTQTKGLMEVWNRRGVLADNVISLILRLNFVLTPHSNAAESNRY